MLHVHKIGLEFLGRRDCVRSRVWGRLEKRERGEIAGGCRRFGHGRPEHLGVGRDSSLYFRGDPEQAMGFGESDVHR